MDRDDPGSFYPDESRGGAVGRGRLDGHRILVVGAGQRAFPGEDPPVGNGRAISLLAAREGAVVACADRSEERARKTADRIASEGGRARVLEADVRRPDDVKRMVEQAHERMEGLDGLVCNVGIGGPMGLEEQTPEAWDRVLEVNLRGHMLSCRHALPRLSEGGSIVLISSVAGLKPGSLIPSYDASKAGLEGLCRHVALEGAGGHVRCNVVAPGFMDTPLGRLASRDRPSREKTPIPLNRQGTGWETAYPVVFLLSDEAAYLTGQVLAVDGGLSTLM